MNIQVLLLLGELGRLLVKYGPEGIRIADAAMAAYQKGGLVALLTYLETLLPKTASGVAGTELSTELAPIVEKFRSQCNG